jgi:hypothetical protein
MMCEFFNVVRQAIALPLSIHLLLAAQAEAAELFIPAQVTTHRFYRGTAARDHVSARLRIDPRFHPIGETRMP